MKIKYIRKVTAIILMLAALLSLLVPTVLAVGEDTFYTEISLPQIFSDGMVLQRGKPIKIYGYADNDNAQISITLAGEEKNSSVADGYFEAEFTINEASFGNQITVSVVGGSAEIVINDVAIGEVVVVSGGVNADIPVGKMEDIEEYQILADAYTNLSFYDTEAIPAAEKDKIGLGAWMQPTAESLPYENISAIGYVAGVNLAAEFGSSVPVGVICLAADANIAAFLDYESVATLSPTDKKAIIDSEREYFAKYGTFESETPEKDVPTSIYNALFASLVGYTASAVIWYQGEGDVRAYNTLGTKESGVALTYTDWFLALHEQLKTVFNNESLPIVSVQLAPYIDDVASIEDLADFRAEQNKICTGGEPRYLVSAAKSGFKGTSFDFELENYTMETAAKSAIGTRCANTIIEKVYLEVGDVSTMTPQYATNSFYFDEKSRLNIVLTFTTKIKKSYQWDNMGFEFYNSATGEWERKSGYMLAVGNQIEFTLGQVDHTFTKVRYGYGLVCRYSDGKAYNIESWTHDVTGISVKLEGLSDSFRVDMYDNPIMGLELPGLIYSVGGVPLPAFEANIR